MSIDELRVVADPARSTSPAQHAVHPDGRVPASRYWSPEFFDLERRYLWPRTWQVACRVDEVPEPGDFTEYQILDQSYLVVRGGDGRIRAFQNACRHRATALARGTGTFLGATIACPFHGWRYGLDGTSDFVYGSEGFNPECLAPDDVSLLGVPTEVRWGMVFINPDPSAEPLEDALGGLTRALDPLEMERMGVDWWRFVVLRTNWKTAQEAFMEGFHTPTTHPQLANYVPLEQFDPSRQTFAVDPRGHGWATYAGGPASPLRTNTPQEGMTAIEYLALSNRLLHEGVEGWVTERQLEIQEELMARGIPDQDFTRELFAAVEADAAAHGIRIPPRTPESTGHAHVFPNTTIISYLGNAIVYRSRPDGLDPTSCIFEAWALSMRPDGAEPVRPTLEGPVAPEDWPLILQQDIVNMERQQLGVTAPGLGHVVFSSYEAMIPNMHRALDSALARGERS